MPEPADIEITALVEAVHRQYGFDFRNYARASLSRRLARQLENEHLHTLAELQERLLADPACMERLLLTMSINVTEMFRDPPFFAALRADVLPFLRTYPSIRIWVAGCSTGEEVYSLAILLREEGLHERARIYGTDINEAVIEGAKRGTYPLDRMRAYTDNYQRSSPRSEFSSYYTAAGGHAVFHRELTKNVVFAKHDLAIDGPFNEFQLVLCRNVMIYFDRVLQHRVVRLFGSSLCRFGVLGLGSRESLRFTDDAGAFVAIDRKNRLYRLR